ncbi:hypothetical protein [Streptomyces sp. AC495_CC817]|uniref:hypothetical protein n=1 Tax=Streptomyces sp. AC495_CC817 TaxID=2823900 RepID=UPI001C254492|nr:hypothetical protein [Streptomyces sp. AC495_CC817]
MEDGEPEGSAGRPGRSRPSPADRPAREAESLGAGASGGPDGSGTAGRAGPADPEEVDADGADERSGGVGAAVVAAEPFGAGRERAVRRPSPWPGTRGPAGAGRTGWWAARGAPEREFSCTAGDVADDLLSFVGKAQGVLNPQQDA